MKEIKRKHFRFPAYDDETGVKLSTESNRVLFDGVDDLMNQTDQHPQQRYGRTKEFHFDESEREQTRQKKQRRTMSETTKVAPRQEKLERYKESLPEYGKHYQPKTSPTGQKKLFGEKNHVQTNQSVTSPARSTKSSKTNNVTHERSYFVPKFIPASIIPDPRETQVTENELIQSMKKTEDAYLLFDTESTPYQEKKGDKTVKSFHKGEEETAVKTTNKKTTKAKKAHGVLERSLHGLIEDQGNSLKENSYFKQ
ncbi:hypothetical protein [Candidatus Enterococcus courvalinii]|uniref:Uncharacterized protein n=1 Tax=Candidatus Enterococcus courvalinii TaxID=2815329 RepID=A0ABS3I025_9ENTE|nr:hypothetical protein [Enterococcus sp. MSG2901]MBO0482062.1 hypothetical protein [Enterococcus sp. MSG2901]